MNKILCFFKKHKRGLTDYEGHGVWCIKCKRCGYTIKYKSPHARLIATEIRFGFTGE